MKKVIISVSNNELELKTTSLAFVLQLLSCYNVDISEILFTEYIKFSLNSEHYYSFTEMDFKVTLKSEY